MSEPWAPYGEPFCWQPRCARQTIRDGLDGENTVSTALNVYDALTEIASEKRSSEFSSTHAFIAMRTGLSPRTIQDRIKDLIELKLITFSVPKVKAPGTFNLIRVKRHADAQQLPIVQQPLPNDAQPLPNDRQPLVQVALPRSQESLKNSKEYPEDAARPDVEPLPGFPKTEEEAVSRLPILLQEHRNWAIAIFHKALGRGGRDAKDVPIRRWENYAQHEWKYEQERRARPGRSIPAGLPQHVTGEVTL